MQNPRQNQIDSTATGQSAQTPMQQPNIQQISPTISQKIQNQQKTQEQLNVQENSQSQEFQSRVKQPEEQTNEQTMVKQQNKSIDSINIIDENKVIVVENCQYEPELQKQEKQQQERKNNKISKPYHSFNDISFQLIHHQQSLASVKKSRPMTLQTLMCSKCGITQSDLKDKAEILLVDQNQAYCEDCFEEVLAQQQKQIKYLEEKYIFYKQFQSSLDQNQIIAINKKLLKPIDPQSPTYSPIKKKTQEELKYHQEIIDEIETLEAELCILKVNSKQMNEQSLQLQQKILTMEAQEEKFWEAISKYDKRTVRLQQKALTAKFQKNNYATYLQNFSQTSVIHQFFDIKIQDYLGYVNGLAMGKRNETTDISWEEVNAGLGHLYLSFNFLISNYNYEMRVIQDIRLKGSLTQIKLNTKKQFTSIGYLSRQQEKQFGQCLEAFLLQCSNLSIFMRSVENVEYSQDMNLPFEFDERNCKIGEFYIDPTKLDERNKWISWTKAMRYFLINFNHLLTIYAVNDNLL